MRWAGGGRRRNRGSKPVFLDRWKEAAASRRTRLEKLLAAAPLSGQRLAEIQAWRKSLAAKKAWLEARLEHVAALQELLDTALKDKP